MFQKVKAKVVELIEEIEVHMLDTAIGADAEVLSALGTLQAAAKQYRALVEAKLGDKEQGEPQPVEPPPAEPAQEAKGDASESEAPTPATGNAEAPEPEAQP